MLTVDNFSKKHVTYIQPLPSHTVPWYVHTTARFKPENLLVDPRTGNMKLSGFGRAGFWDPATGGANDLVYAPSETPPKLSAPEVRVVPPLGERVRSIQEGLCQREHGGETCPYFYMPPEPWRNRPSRPSRCEDRTTATYLSPLLKLVSYRIARTVG